MVRTFNYMNGKEYITTKLISRLIRRRTHPSFSCKFNFDEGKYPADARVFLEADRRESVSRMRFDYGTVEFIRYTHLSFR